MYVNLRATIERETAGGADIVTQNTTAQHQWIISAKRGDRIAFNQLILAYQNSVYNLCLNLLGTAEDAEDAVQETFLRVYNRLDSFDESRRFSAWLYAIARNYCRDQLKKPGRHTASWEEVPTWRQPICDPMTLPETLVIQAQTKESVRSFVASLPPEYYEPLALRYWQALSCREISRQLGLPVTTIKSRLFRARKMMASVAV